MFKVKSQWILSRKIIFLIVLCGFSYQIDKIMVDNYCIHFDGSFKRYHSFSTNDFFFSNEFHGAQFDATRRLC